ncbi:MAG TPA: PIN domain-containing protein [Chryseosolibacter sp.]
MENVLIDTSVWIEYFANRQPELTQKVEEFIFTAEVCTCYPVLQEVLQGIRFDEQHAKTKTYLLDLKLLREDPVLVSIEAADLYRFLRKKGITIRSSQDCTIAWFAINFNAKLVHNDRDFDTIARYTNLKIA